MLSGIGSSLAGALFAPVSQYAVDKLAKGVIRHLSQDKPSSSSSSNQKNYNQQVLYALVKELQDVSQKIKATLGVAKLLHKQDQSVLYFYKQLKDVLYEAEDLADDFEYLKLEEQVEKMNNDYEATASTQQSIAKKPRISPTKPLELQDDTMIANIREVIRKLNLINDDLSSVISMARVSMELGKKDDNNAGVVLQHLNQNQRETTSSINSKISGRDRELEILTKLIKESGANDGCNVNVIPIVGMGGIGKTTLTQHAYNDNEVAKYFDEKVWICVSDDFNRSKILQDIVSSLNVSKSGKFTHDRNLNLLEGELKRNLQGKKLLLVLDDVWSSDWEKLLIPLQSSQMMLAKIVITTRESKVLRKIDEKNKIVLKGIEDHDYWEFFVSCAFGDTEANEHPSLQAIGKQIVKKLKGSPLAAKTVGRLLEQSISIEHWKDVLKSNLWELETSGDDIMPALALSYNHLPEHLQQCFIFCSTFPKDHQFVEANLIEMWIAQGYVVEPETSSKTVEEMGRAYFDELLSRSFFEKSYSSMYTIHDLMHDLAQSVGLGEYVICHGLKTIKDNTSVRHLCVQASVKLRSICNVGKLRTLIIVSNIVLCQEDYDALKSIRVLILCDYQKQKCSYSIGHLRHLRYLGMSQPSIKLFDESLCKLYHLRVLPYLDVFHENLHKLINLRSLNSSTDHQLFHFTKHTPPEIRLWRERQYRISQLRNMEELRGLLINDLEKIANEEEVEKANIEGKSHLEALYLRWGNSDTSHSFTTTDEVLEALKPNPNLKHLYIEGYKGSASPSWFMPFTVHNLRILELTDCRCKLYLQSIGQLPFLSQVFLYKVDVRIDIGDEVTILFPALERLVMGKSSVLFESMPSSLSSQRLSSFPRLSYVEYNNCYGDGLGLPWHMFSTLQTLRITCSQGLYDHISMRLILLKKLVIYDGKMVSFVGEMNAFKALSHLTISWSRRLTSIGGLHFISSLCSLEISNCYKFTSWLGERMEQGALLQKLSYICLTFCKKLESLPIWLPHLPSLEKLEVRYCESIRSLPEGGLPASLKSLHIIGCDQGLMERCREEGSSEWFMARHIPDQKFTYN